MSGNWRRATVGEIAGLRTDQVRPLPGDATPYVALEHIPAGGGRLNGVARAGDAVSHKTRFRQGDSLFGKLRPNLRKVVRAPYDGVCSTDIIAVSAKAGCDASFLYHVLASDRVYHHVMGDLTGTKMPRTSWSRLASFPFDCPSLPEQRAIAAVLDAIDDAIERTEAVIGATERLREALLHELLTRGVSRWHSEWKQVPGLGTVPGCWDVVRLGTVASVQTGRAVNKRVARNGHSELPYLSVANVKDGYLDLSVVKTMLVSPEEQQRFGLRIGDVLFTEGGDADKLGRGTVWRGEIDVCLHQNHVFAVRPHNDVLAPDFLGAFAGSAAGKRYFLGSAKQTTNLASINSTQLKHMPLPLPSLKEQMRIVETLEAVAATRSSAVGGCERLRAVKAVVAEALLTGRVRVAGVAGARHG